MTTSFYNGISGLKSFQDGIDIWGNNIANINTAGYKEQIPEFSTLFSDMLSINKAASSDFGAGSTLSSSAINLSQGSLINTDNPFDLAINGKGWFALSGGDGQTYYTRTGSFTRDANGYLTDGNGNRLLVANAENLVKNSDGSYFINRDVNTSVLINANTQMSPISLPNNVVLPALPTSEATLTANLNNSEQITTISPASENIDFSALYSKDGEDLKVRQNDSFIFGFGNQITYENNLISTELCINDDVKDSQNVIYDFTVNGKRIYVNLPDGSTKTDIQNALQNALENAGILTEKTDKGIKISDPKQLIIISNNDNAQNTAAAKLYYSPSPSDKYEFSTVKNLDDILQNLADTAYPGETDVYLDEDGKINIQNNTDLPVYTYALNTENTNEAFMNNFKSLSGEIFPQTSNKSFAFLTNTQNFGGNIIQADSQIDNLSISFTKQKVLNDQTVWSANLNITDPSSNNIFSKTFELVFNDAGELISPETVTITSPQNITLKFNLTSFDKNDTTTNYSYTQNGIEKGGLENYQILTDGKIEAVFSNGQTVTLGQIPVYHFQNPQGLESLGENIFKSTDNSNQAFLYTDENGNYISEVVINSGALEASNVDFSQAMTELIITQKAFSSAAKTVTTSDQMIQRAIDMKKA
ncbi:flagellar hook-basal body complex protein [Nautilia sp.]